MNKKSGLFIFLILFLSQLLPGQNPVELDAFLSDQVERYRLPGASVTIVSGEEVIFSRGYGEGIAPDRPYFIGSLSKVFTATAVMQLLEEGKASLSDPVAQWLPEIIFKGPDPENLTIEHLLRHRSGLVRRQGFLPLPSLAQLKAQDFSLTLHFSPGSREAYSNLNYSLLGLIVERVSGRSYADYMQDHLFQPLEMQNSVAAADTATVPDVAQGYRYWFGFPFRAGREKYRETSVPAGFLISSAEDVVHFLSAQLQYGRYGEQQILAPESIGMMHEPGGDGSSRYGIGWNLGNWNGRPVWQHSGATGTSYTYMAVLPDRNAAFFFTTNINAFNPVINSIEEIPKGIFHWLDGGAPQRKPPLHIYLLRAFGLLLLLVFLDLGIKTFKWLKAGMPMDSGNSRGDLLKLIFLKLIFPVGLLWIFLRYFEISLNGLLSLQPDIGWTVVIAVFAGFLAGFLEHFTKVKVQKGH